MRQACKPSAAFNTCGGGMPGGCRWLSGPAAQRSGSACRRTGHRSRAARARRRPGRRADDGREGLAGSRPGLHHRHGTPIEPRNLNRHFVRLLERAELRRIRFHDLRHSCATLLYEQGVPIEKIQDVLGHSSPTITKLIYVEVTRQAQRSTTDKLGYLFDA